MRSFYLRICVYAIKKWLFSGTYPLIYSDRRSFYMQIHYMRAYFWSPYLLHITRSTCTVELCSQPFLYMAVSFGKRTIWWR